MTKKNQSSPSTSGFTLLEVLIAVLIVGIIATVALPMLGSYTEKAREAREEANLTVKEQALDRYRMDHQAPPGFAYDTATGELVSYGPEYGQGAAVQLLNPTDANGNVLGDPVSASPGPFIHGPYLAELPPEPAALLLGGASRPKTASITGEPVLLWLTLTWGPDGKAAGIKVKAGSFGSPGHTHGTEVPRKGTPARFSTTAEQAIPMEVLTEIEEQRTTIARLMDVIDASLGAKKRLTVERGVIRESGIDEVPIVYGQWKALEDRARPAIQDWQQVKGAGQVVEYVRDDLAKIVQQQVDYEDAVNNLSLRLTAPERLLFDVIVDGYDRVKHAGYVLEKLKGVKSDVISFTPHLGLGATAQGVGVDEPNRSAQVVKADIEKAMSEAEDELVSIVGPQWSSLLKLGFLAPKQGVLGPNSFTRTEYLEAVQNFAKKSGLEERRLKTVERDEHWLKAEQAMGYATRPLHILMDIPVRYPALKSDPKTTVAGLLRDHRAGKDINGVALDLAQYWGAGAAGAAALIEAKYLKEGGVQNAAEARFRDWVVYTESNLRGSGSHLRPTVFMAIPERVVSQGTMKIRRTEAGQAWLHQASGFYGPRVIRTPWQALEHWHRVIKLEFELADMNL